MSASNNHTHLRQAITSIKQACARNIRSRGAEYQPLLHQEPVSSEQDSKCYQNEKATVTVVEVRKASATTSRFNLDSTRTSDSAEFADMMHRYAMFHHMAMRS